MDIVEVIAATGGTAGLGTALYLVRWGFKLRGEIRDMVEKISKKEVDNQAKVCAEKIKNMAKDLEEIKRNVEGEDSKLEKLLEKVINKILNNKGNTN